WGKDKARFVVECKALSTPKSFQDGINRLKAVKPPKGYNLMLFVPFLSEQQLRELEQEGISGIDLCGNGVVVARDKFAVFRSGGKNRFTSSAPIKNIYRRNSSMVGRVFLARSLYDTVQDVWLEINRRNLLAERWDKTPMSISTVSKVLKTLQEDLIITREGAIRLLQPDKLLQKLSESYASPNIRTRVRLKVSEETGPITELLREASQSLDLPMVATGTSSVKRYAVMERGPLLSVYCPRLDVLIERVPGSQSDRFPNLELVETEDETVFFDSRYEGNFWWASPIQVYLELKAGDKRDQETAEQLRSYIINNLNQVHR
ncbi:MAG TPA: hypothetical protein PKJ77_07070, partial [Thermodesulfobacteriota bacterium]|nr:hypothetical protein [Thermodesulfobacteriota bacterium]